jgi:hypothetical protein
MRTNVSLKPREFETKAEMDTKGKHSYLDFSHFSDCSKGKLKDTDTVIPLGCGQKMKRAAE